MHGDNTAPRFLSQEAAIFWRYISSSLERLLAVASDAPPAALNWQPPAPRTNSIEVLVAHTLGNAEENLLGTLCQRPVTRNHAKEFAYRAHDVEELRMHWQQLHATLVKALACVSTDALDALVEHPRRGNITGREVLIIVARHAAEHLGQAELTRDLWLAQHPTPDAAPAII